MIRTRIAPFCISLALWIAFGVFLVVGVSACSWFTHTPPKKFDSVKLVSLSRARHFIGRLAWPVKGAKVSSGFGNRRSGFHEGLDIPAPEGVPIYAAHGGQVVYRNSGIRGYGKMIVVRTDGLLTVYGHLSEYHARLGDSIKAGDLLGYVGSTGVATGPHLHFETRIKDTQGRNIAVDPLVFYRKG